MVIMGHPMFQLNVNIVILLTCTVWVNEVQLNIGKPHALLCCLMPETFKLPQFHIMFLLGLPGPKLFICTVLHKYRFYDDFCKSYAHAKFPMRKTK